MLNHGTGPSGRRQGILSQPQELRGEAIPDGEQADNEEDSQEVNQGSEHGYDDISDEFVEGFAGEISQCPNLDCGEQIPPGSTHCLSCMRAINLNDVE